MWDDLVLLRLWAAPEAGRGEVRSRVAADLRAVVGDPAEDGAGWRAAFAAAVERLVGEGCVAVDGRGAARLRLSATGRERVRRVFKIAGEHGADEAGRGRKAGWAWWRDHYAMPVALGGERVGSADELRSVLLRRFYLPELAQGKRAVGLKQMVDLLLAKRLKVGQTRPGALRQAMLREWAKPLAEAGAEGRMGVGAVVPGGGSVGLERRLPEDLMVFAERTLSAARRSATGRYGDDKVFVAHVWRSLVEAGQAAPGEGDGFKERLVRANTAGLLRLSRADLTGAHAGEDVRASEIHYLGEKFHFVRID